MHKNNLVLNILLTISSNDLGYTRCNVVQADDDSINNGDYAKQHLINQQGDKVKKFGITRLRSLELLHAILQRLYPSFGPLMQA